MDYTVIRSARKTISLQIMADGSLLVRCPLAMGEEEIKRFVQSKQRWVVRHMPKEKLPTLTQGELAALVKSAAEEIPKIVSYYARQLGVQYGRISIRKQHTRWGSCSSKGNLNFNCLLMLAPREVLAYVVVHELCHRKHMNHSQSFWQSVEAIFPEYKTAKKWLKDNGTQLISRL